MRLLCLVITVLLATAGPALAQDADLPQRTELARRLVQVSQGAGLAKMVEAQVVQQMGGLEEMPERERNWILANVPPMASRMAARMLEDIVVVYAETYSVAELEGMVAFFDSPLGRGISEKAFGFGVRQGEVITARQREFMVDLMTKYCGVFTCGGGGSPAGPKGS